jgi:hypothetical protein
MFKPNMDVSIASTCFQDMMGTISGITIDFAYLGVWFVRLLVGCLCVFVCLFLFVLFFWFLKVGVMIDRGERKDWRRSLFSG